MNEPEIVYIHKKISAPILWEKIYYNQELIDGSKNLRGKETGKWQGVAFLYRFLILKGVNKNRFLIKPFIEEYGGNNEEEMVVALEKLVEGKGEWNTKGKHFKEVNFFPEEVNQKLLEFNLEKYVKKIS